MHSISESAISNGARDSKSARIFALLWQSGWWNGNNTFALYKCKNISTHPHFPSASSYECTNPSRTLHILESL